MKTAPTSLFIFGLIPLLQQQLSNAHPFGLAPYSHTIELLWLQDFSSSFDDDLPNIRSQFGEVVEELKWTFPHSKFGLAGFVDKPVDKFGFESSKDYCYQLRYPLTRYTGRVKDSLQKARTHSGGDWAESQLDAMLTAAVSNATRWSIAPKTPNGYLIHRLMAVVTDAGFHKAGDAKNLKTNTATGELNCLGEDYPSVEQLKAALTKRSITPIFLVTKDVVPIYRRLVRDIGGNGAVWEITSDSTNIRSALAAAINAVIANECEGGRCDGGCVGDNCCNGSDCDDTGDAVVIHIDQMPKNVTILLED